MVDAVPVTDDQVARLVRLMLPRPCSQGPAPKALLPRPCSQGPAPKALLPRPCSQGPAPKAEATAPSRQHRLAEVPRGTPVALAAKPLWPVPDRAGEGVVLA